MGDGCWVGWGTKGGGGLKYWGEEWCVRFCWRETWKWKGDEEEWGPRYVGVGMSGGQKLVEGEEWWRPRWWRVRVEEREWRKTWKVRVDERKLWKTRWWKVGVEE